MPSFAQSPRSTIRIADNPIDITGSLYAIDNNVTLLDVGGNSWNNTTISYNGTLKLGLDDAMPATTVVTIGSTSNTSGTLDLNGYNQTIAGLQDQGTGNRRVVNSGSGTPTLTVNNSADYTFAGTLGATGMDNFGLTKTGTGTLTLAGTNVLTGPITVSEGVLAFSAAENLGSGTIVLDGGTLRSTGDGGSNDILTVSNAILLTADSVLDTQHNAYTRYAGVIDDGAGSFGFTRIGSNHLRLDAANTYDGETYLNQGITYLYHDQALGSTLGATTVAAGAQLAVQVDYLTAETVYLNGGTIRTASTNTAYIFAGDIVLGATSTVHAKSGTGTLNLTGVISGAYGLNVANGTGIVRLGGANTYTGDTRIVAGTLVLDNALALQNTTLDLASGDAGALTFGTPDAYTLGGLTGSRDLDMGGKTLRVGNNGQDTTYSGVLSNGSLAKVGAGTFTLTGDNTYAGTTGVEAGILKIGHANALGDTGAGTTVLAGAVLDLAGFNIAEPITLDRRHPAQHGHGHVLHGNADSRLG